MAPNNRQKFWCLFSDAIDIYKCILKYIFVKSLNSGLWRVYTSHVIALKLWINNMKQKIPLKKGLLQFNIQIEYTTLYQLHLVIRCKSVTLGVQWGRHIKCALCVNQNKRDNSNLTAFYTCNTVNTWKN